MRKRVHIVIRGAVQGVGFRPFVYRLANELRLHGWVINASDGVTIEAEGEPEEVEEFLLRLEPEKPPRAFLQSFEFSYLDPAEYAGFTIRESESRGGPTTLVLPDIATCPDCLADITDPANRRFGYPFTNCTNCGPRFTIIEGLPYDRAATSMRHFAMCAECRREYEDPLDRRFHAQPNACPDCGPQVELWDGSGTLRASRAAAIAAAADMLDAGKIVAVKGLGGFHLMVDARDEDAVVRMRLRKRREEKPFALMAPGIRCVEDLCVVDRLEERLLRSAEAPIVLLRKRPPELAGAQIAQSVCPGNPWLGFMLPSTPLHHLLMRRLGYPVVATSGNLSDEPICTDAREASHRLSGIADAYLVHNRPIVRHADDSIVRVLLGRELVLRRARGYAPLPVAVPAGIPDTLAMGGHLKSTVAISRGANIFISQHLGDLETEQSLQAFRHAVEDLKALYALEPTRVICDMHPDYVSTSEARATGLPLHAVQHHHAHIASCMAENGLEGPVLGVSWDGTGWGPDGTIWGGEFLLVDRAGYRRTAAFRAFSLPGGSAAVREPRRTALGLLYEGLGPALFEDPGLLPVCAFTERERSLIRQMLARGLNAPRTTSAGRLFDGVASILGLRQRCSFEGQAAMELEWTAGGRTDQPPYEVPLLPRENGCLVVDWVPLIARLIEDLRNGTSVPLLAARFHASMAESIVAVARAAGERRVALSGGCFQNALLTTLAVRRLEENGFLPYWHQRVPPNDGGISLGQIYAEVVLKGQLSAPYP